MKPKMYCVFSKPAVKKMKGIRGKLAAMAGHAFLHAFLDAQKKHPELAEEYINDPDSTKIVCTVETDLDLQKIAGVYCNSKTIGAYYVRDAGYTVFEEPTYVCIGIGPLYEHENGVLKHLPLLK